MALIDILKKFHKKQVGQIKGIFSAVGRFTPGRELARGIGFSLGSLSAEQQQKELNKQQQELDAILFRKIKTSTGEDKKRLINIARRAGRVNVIQESIKEAPSTRQVLASAGELALFAALGYKVPSTVGLSIRPVAGATIRAARTATKAAKLAKVPPGLQKGYKALKFGGKLAREATIGAGFFGLMEAAEEDTDTDKIIKAAETGAIFGPAAFGALTALGAVARGTAKILGPPLKKGIQKGIGRLEQMAIGEPTEKVVAGAKTQIQKTLSYIGESISPFKKKVAGKAVQLVTGARKLKQRFIDRYASLQRVENQLIEYLGRPLKESEKIYRDVRLLQSTADAVAEKKVVGLLTDLKPHANIRDKYTAYVTQIEFLDRVRLGQAVPGNQTEKELISGLARIIKEIGPDDMKRVAQARQTLRTYHINLLQERVDAGLISQGTMDNLMKTHPNYFPHNVIMDVEEKAVYGLSQSLNVPKTDIMKAVGSTRNIQDPVAATIQRTPIATRMIEKNKLLNNLIRAQEKTNIMPGARALETAENFQRRIDLLTDLKELGKQNRKIRQRISFEKRGLRKIESKFNKTQKEMDVLFEEAAVRASEFETKSKITSLIEKASTRERKIHNILGKKEITLSRKAELDSLLSERVEFVKELRDELQLVKKLKKLPGEEVINFYRDGIKESWVVPGDIAAAIKNTDTVLTPSWWKVITTPQKILKKGATQYNLSFSLPNKFRDKQTAALTAEAFIDSMAQKTGATPTKLGLTRKQIRELYKTSGGYGASIFKEGEETIWRKFSKNGVGEVVEKANPFKAIEAINDRLETSTRLEVFKKALKRGLSPRDAALVSRDATIDFARMGTWMKWANQAVPFLNARVQGFVNLPRAMASNPESFARMQMWTAAYPTMLLHAHNRRFDSYQHVSQYFKNKYWIIMTGEVDGIDEYTGQPIKIPQFVRIPKGEGQALVSGPIQFALEKSDGIDYRKTSEMLADVIGSASPLEFQGFDQSNFAGTAISQFGPATTIAVGEATNIHPTFGTQIVPEKRLMAPTRFQFKKSTPEVVKEASNILGLPPAKVQFWLDSLGAGTSKDIQRTADFAYGIIRDGKLANNSVSETPFGFLTQTPIFRRFTGEAQEYFGPEIQYRQKQKEEIERGVTGERLLIEDKATKIWKELNKRETEEEKLSYLNSLGDELTPEIKQKILGWKKSRQTVEVLKKSDSVEIRARYIYQRLLEMAHFEDADKLKYLQELEDKKILTDKVRERILELKSELIQ